MRFNCCNATRPMLNKAQAAAANSGKKTTRSLVSAIKKVMFTAYEVISYHYIIIQIL